MTTEKRAIDKDNLLFNISTVLVDIEGTTTSINFVKETLFPYAREHLEEYVNSKWSEKEFQEDVTLLREQAIKDEADKVQGVVDIPEGDGDEVKTSVIKNVLWQMDNDRKTKALKQLQGHIWRSGYTSGKLIGHLYDDVKDCLKSWTEAGKKIYVYSSGSVEAQKLLFGNTKDGDLLHLFSGYFDTEVGPKTESASYVKILEKLKENGHGLSDANDVIFLTDVPKEAKAATDAGMQVAIVIREGNAPLPDDTKECFPTISSFSDLTFEGNAKRRKLSHEPEIDDKIKNIKGGNDAAKDTEMEVCSIDNSTASDSLEVDSKGTNKTTLDSLTVNNSDETTKTSDSEKVSNSDEKQSASVIPSTEKVLNSTSGDVSSSEDSKVEENSVKSSGDAVKASVEKDVVKDADNECSPKETDVKGDVDSSVNGTKVLNGEHSKGDAPDSTVESDDVEMKEPDAVKESEQKIELNNEKVAIKEVLNEKKLEEKSESCEKVKEATNHVVDVCDKQDVTPKEIKPEEISNKDKNLEATLKDDGKLEPSRKEEVKPEETPNDVKPEETPKEDVKPKETPKEDVKPEETVKENGKSEETQGDEKSEKISEGNDPPNESLKDTTPEEAAKDVDVEMSENVVPKPSSNEESKPVAEKQLDISDDKQQEKQVPVVEISKESTVAEKENSEKPVTDVPMEEESVSKIETTEKEKVDESKQTTRVEVANVSSEVENSKETQNDSKEVNGGLSDKEISKDSGGVDSTEDVKNKKAIANELEKDKTEENETEKPVDNIAVDKTETKKADNDEIVKEVETDNTNSEVLNTEKTTGANEETDDKKTEINKMTLNGTHETIKNGVINGEPAENTPDEISIKEKKVEKMKESSTEQNGVETTGEV